MMKRLTDPRTADDDRSGAPPDLGADERSRSLEDAADAAMLAPSVHGSQPWVVVLHADDRSPGCARVRPWNGSCWS